MCGVVATIDPRVDLIPALQAMGHRGPDAGGIIDHGLVRLGHRRLAIIDLDHRSDQPFRYGHTVISYNGEVWNFRDVRRDLINLGYKFETDGDTEVVAAALDRFGWRGLRVLDGMFAVAWAGADGVLWLARDRFGEIPLHWNRSGAASEIRAMQASEMGPPVGYVPPGGLVRLEPGQAPKVSRWHANGQPRASDLSLEQAAWQVRQALCQGVADRTLADVPVCSLLSGGLDSTAIAWAAKQAMPSLVCYTAVTDPNGVDVRHARLAADAIGCELREVLVREPELRDLKRVAWAIEMPHKAQIEIGWPCLELAERIAADGFKVVFSGEGSDELWGSYGFAYHGIQAQGFGPYRRHLFLDQHRKNFARCNKIFMQHSIECRLPFLHPPLVDLAWSLPESAVRLKHRPKAVLEEAFRDVVPAKIVDRPKVAFQIGLKLDDAAAAVGGSRQFYAEAAGVYASDDHWGSASTDGEPVAPDYREVREEARDPQRSFFE